MKQRQSNTWLLIIIFLSALCIAGSFTASNLMKKEVYAFVKNSSELENIILDAIDIPTVGLELKQRNEVTILKNKIRSDEKMQAITQKLTPIFIKDLVLGTKSDVEFVKHDLLDIVGKYESQFLKYLPGANTEVKKITLKRSINMWNLRADYQKQRLLVKAYMPFPFMLLLMCIFALSSMGTKIVSSILLLGSVTYYIGKEKGNDSWWKRLGKPFLYSGIVIAIGTLIFKGIYTGMPYKYTRYFGTLSNSNFYILALFAFLYVVIGAGMIMYSTHKNTNEQQLKEE